MRHAPRGTTLRRLCAAGALCFFTSAIADEIGDALGASEQALRAARESQLRVNRLDDEAHALQEKRRAAEFQAQQVGAYARQIEGLAQDEERKRADLEAQLARAAAIGRDLQPLLERMAGELEQLVAASPPFLLKERRERVARLRALVADPARGVTDKYRGLLEALRTEVDYGHSLGAEEAQVALGGRSSPATLVRVGRVSLYCLTDDGRAGAWEGGAWRELGADAAKTVKQALAVARGDAPPELLVLPVVAVP
ncbi:MAG TPA: DUF3450 domain-containing protein [Candidatus Binatia bacterium]|nr:DUF3450 domain-containing protein [Candidatus Binatia bacterium]